MTGGTIAPMKPYGRDESRVRALYRIFAPGERRRVLEICWGATGALGGEPWPDEAAITCVVGRAPVPAQGASPGAICRADARALPFARGSFDLVVLHGTLDGLTASDPAWRDPSALDGFVAGAIDLLTPRGVLAGCVSNRFRLARWLRGGHARVQPPGWFSLGSCTALLRRAPLRDVQLFTVIPDAQAPLGLVSTDRDLSRHAFRRELETVRPALGFADYAVRRLFADLALNRYIEGSLFFCGRHA